MTDERHTWELLRRGGADRQEAGATKYNGLADPPGAEELAQRLAALVRDLAPTAVVIWQDPEDVVLGFVVGRELSVPVIRAYDAEGLVGQSAGLPDEPRVVLIGDAVRDSTVVRAVRALTEQRGGSFAATAVLVETPELRAVANEAGMILSLVRIADETGGSRAGDA
jgi:adenine/guanine phosphoribosyltransferase-like PRPP-binding protein